VTPDPEQSSSSSSSMISRVVQAASTIPAANPQLIVPSASTEILSDNAKPDISQDCFSPTSAQLPGPHSASSGDRTDAQDTVNPTPAPSRHNAQDDDAVSVPAPPAQLSPFISNPAANVLAATTSNPISTKSASPEKLPSGEPAQSQHLESQLNSTVTTGPVQLAHIMNKAAQSEMRIGLSTSVFGDVEVRTVVHASDVGVVIGSQKGDLQMLMSNDLPSISGHLLQQNLHLSHVTFQSAGFDSAGGSSSGANAQQRSSAFKASPPQSVVVESSAEEISSATELRSNAGLSILA